MTTTPKHFMGVSARQVSCPVCNVPTGSACVNREGKGFGISHGDRYSKARAYENHPSALNKFCRCSTCEDQAFREFTEMTSEDMAEYDEA